jgi:hypothetical protein
MKVVDGGSSAATPPPNHLHEGGSIKSGNGQNSVVQKPPDDDSDAAFEANLKASGVDPNGPTAGLMRKARAEQKAAQAKEPDLVGDALKQAAAKGKKV